MKGRQPQHAKQPWGGHAGLQPPWRMYEAAFHPSQHPTTPSGTELEAGRPCWPVLLSCPQLGPISPHPTTDRTDAPAVRPVTHAENRRTLGEIDDWKCRQRVWACVMAWGGQGSVATRPSALQKQNPDLVLHGATPHPNQRCCATWWVYETDVPRKSERIAGLGTCHGWWGRLARAPRQTHGDDGKEGERGEKGRQFYSRWALRYRDMRLFVAQCGGNDGAVRDSRLAAISG